MGYSKLFNIFFLFFSFTTFASSTSLNNNIHKCSAKQSEALLLFKHNLHSINDTSYYDECHYSSGSGHHPIMLSWNTNSDCCNWVGVTYDDSTGDVIGIDVSCGRLQGTLHPNSSLFNLPHLQKLNLAFNKFSDSRIPREIGRFSNSLTHLDLSNCWFSGQVPLDITLLQKLVSLDLSSNYGGLELGPHVFINMFQNFTNLEELSLGDVDISSVLPNRLNISSSLKLLNLRFTGLQGKLPHYIFNLHSLETLDLSFNDFASDIPSDILVNLTHLTSLRLSHNRFNGTLSSWLFTYPSLEYLYLSENMFSGNVPFESFALSSLKELVLSWNVLAGHIDMKIFRKITNITILDLSYNQFTGNIPLEISVNLKQLTSLILSSNILNGTLPSWLFTSPSLEYLYLSENMLSGKVPFESFALPSLKELDLRNNELVGHIDMQSFRQLTC